MDAQQQMQEQLQGADIAKVLREQGPIVKCVVLRATSNDNDDKDKKSAANDAVNNHDLVEEMELDTTPKKNECETILGGPFTFVGQYEEEGIMLMAKRGWIDPDDDDDEEDDNDKPPQHLLNPHKLQPPFDATKIYGDILVIKVAEVADPLDDDEGETTIKTAVPPTASNDEFFLDYTKEQYLTFSARTDVVAPALPPPPVDNEEEEEDEDEDEEDEEECEGESDDEEDEESAKAAMMELLLTNVLKQFRERNGRGPSTEELLVLKKTIAEKLFMELPDEEPPAEEANEEEQDTTTSKRENEAKEDDADEPKKKKVKFGEGTTKDDEDPKAILAQ
ncbi:expressed unknown protein [Seminavis robusta]|uniref:DUF5880 domain-containing protein n=1 Tax=Seminavis robusta TaxID=568900 RepID=A0A9N8HSP9_9STRA|nr:expressed unknown protein [Seminavis robusta]|eukprot:Sro1473_g275660.1 n/a (335) ;mRNA; r:21547-22551